MKRRTESQSEAGNVPEPRERAATRKPEEIKYHVHVIDADTGEGLRFVGSLPVDDDPENFIEESRHVVAGELCRIAQARGSGKKAGSIIKSWRYTKHGAGARDEFEQQGDDEQIEDDGEPIELGLSEEAEERIAQRAARAVVEASEKSRERETTEPATPYDVLKLQDEVIAREDRRRAMIREEVRAAMPAQSPRVSERTTKENPPDPVLTILAEAAKSDPELRVRLADKYLGGGDDSSGGFGAMIARAAFDHPTETQQIIGAVGMALQGLIGNLMPGARGNGHAPAQTGAPTQPADPASVALSIVIEDLKRNRRVGRSADALEELFAKFPHYRDQLVPMLQQGDEAILQLLSQFAGEDLSTYTHALGFMSDLRGELFSDEEDTEEPDTEIAGAIQDGQQHAASAS